LNDDIIIDNKNVTSNKFLILKNILKFFKSFDLQKKNTKLLTESSFIKNKIENYLFKHKNNAENLIYKLIDYFNRTYYRNNNIIDLIKLFVCKKENINFIKCYGLKSLIVKIILEQIKKQNDEVEILKKIKIDEIEKNNVEKIYGLMSGNENKGKFKIFFEKINKKANDKKVDKKVDDKKVDDKKVEEKVDENADYKMCLRTLSVLCGFSSSDIVNVFKYVNFKFNLKHFSFDLNSFLYFLSDDEYNLISTKHNIFGILNEIVS
jgi:hypothetical protein